MWIEVCRDENCRRLRTDQRNQHNGHGGQNVEVEIEVVPREDQHARRAAVGGRRLFWVRRKGGVWPADATLLDLVATDHLGGTVSAITEGDEVSPREVAVYIA